VRGCQRSSVTGFDWSALIVADDQDPDWGPYVVTYSPACAAREFDYRWKRAPQDGLASLLLRTRACHACARQKPTRHDQKSADDKEAEVVCGLVTSIFADVVEAKKVMVYEPFHDVEEAPPDENPAAERPPIYRPAPVRRSSPKNPNVDGNDDPGKGMKEAVRKRVVLETPHRGGRVFTLATQEVVPLQNLVQHNSVDKPA
jgi:hypothetical protein